MDCTVSLATLFMALINSPFHSIICSTTLSQRGLTKDAATKLVNIRLIIGALLSKCLRNVSPAGRLEEVPTDSRVPLRLQNHCRNCEESLVKIL